MTALTTKQARELSRLRRWATIVLAWLVVPVDRASSKLFSRASSVLRILDSKSKRLRVPLDAIAERARLIRKGQRGLFIDCGSNLGQGFIHFRQYYPERLYDYVLIEPNPFCLPTLQDLQRQLGGRIEIIAEAASTQAGEAHFYGLSEDARGNTSTGGSILKDHNSVFYVANEQKAIQVRTFSLARFLYAKKGNYASIVMKLDIEGAEYEVLEDLIATEAHRCLDLIYVEYHSQYMVEPNRTHYRKRELAIRKRFKQDRVPFRFWV